MLPAVFTAEMEVNIDVICLLYLVLQQFLLLAKFHAVGCIYQTNLIAFSYFKIQFSDFFNDNSILQGHY